MRHFVFHNGSTFCVRVRFPFPFLRIRRTRAKKVSYFLHPNSPSILKCQLTLRCTELMLDLNQMKINRGQLISSDFRAGSWIHNIFLIHEFNVKFIVKLIVQAPRIRSRRFTHDNDFTFRSLTVLKTASV